MALRCPRIQINFFASSDGSISLNFSSSYLTFLYQTKRIQTNIIIQISVFHKSGYSNNIQLVGTEQIIIIVNFSSKPFGLAADYNIEGKPLILIDNKTYF